MYGARSALGILWSDSLNFLLTGGMLGMLGMLSNSTTSSWKPLDSLDSLDS